MERIHITIPDVHTDVRFTVIRGLSCIIISWDNKCISEKQMISHTISDNHNSIINKPCRSSQLIRVWSEKIRKGSYSKDFLLDAIVPNDMFLGPYLDKESKKMLFGLEHFLISLVNHHPFPLQCYKLQNYSLDLEERTIIISILLLLLLRLT